ncbi:MAG: class I SAM-dependent methyltransferase [Bryobacteraceae bacterium]|jgi:SAM-dependent methyltransferase
MGGAGAAAGGPPVPTRLTPRSVWDCSVEDILNLSEDLRTGEECSEAVRLVLRLGPQDLDPALLHDGERALPSEPRFLESGYSRMMLARYLVPGALHCRGRCVLDSGCGLGWGAFLLSWFAARVVAFDRDPLVVEFARRTWPAENIEWLTGDVLDESFLAGRRFDVITAMETIEHLHREDSERYVAWMASRLEPNGLVIGTSGFPSTRAEAERLAAQNPHHPWIHTEG